VSSRGAVLEDRHSCLSLGPEGLSRSSAGRLCPLSLRERVRVRASVDGSVLATATGSFRALNHLVLALTPALSRRRGRSPADV
jgi:hypothetical protein